MNFQEFEEKRSKLNLSHGYTVKRDKGKYYLSQIKKQQYPIMRLIDQPLSNLHFAFPLHINCPFSDILENFTSKIQQSGLVQKWFYDSIFECHQYDFLNYIEETTTISENECNIGSISCFRQITLNYLQSAWMLLMVLLKKLFEKYCRKKKQLKPGEILDQVISQSSSSECLLYKLADYKRGGDLIDAIQISGSLAVEQLIREQFGVFLYNNGKGEIINRAEFLKWKYRDNKTVIIPIEKSLSSHDPLGKWVDHKACWQMQYRGSLGETLLHVLIICDTKIHTKLARILLKAFPSMAIDIIEGEEYLGASALHLAIAYSNSDLVADLIAAGANVHQRALGSFFLPRDQQRDHPAKHTDYEGLAYMGEYPLAWAACCAEETVYNLLIDAGADPDAQDSFGNMILHMVVVCDKLDMFGYALRHPITSAKNGILNKQGLTPLTLACKLGRAEVFREMLELSSREFWRYSNITCSGYPLAALDTLLPDGRTNWNSALFIILNGTKEEHLDMLDGGIIQRLLEEKWKTFAHRQFLKRLLILFVHLFFLSCSVYLRPENNETANAEKEKEENDNDYDIRQLMRYACEMTTLIGVISFVVFQQGDEIKNQGFQAFLKQLRNAPAKAIFLVSNLLIISCIPFRIMGDVETEEAILILAVPGSWFLLMFFAGAIRLTGPFVTMIYSMLTGDMFTFGIIYSILLVGFSQAFYFLYKGHPEREKSLFNNFGSTWMALFHTTLGDYNYPELNQTSYPNLAKSVFVIFVIFVPILLLNMLIAMMGNTYALVIERSEKEWMKQWAKIVVTLERAVPQADAQKYLEAYSIPLGTTDDGQEQRGVMVIKSKSKTRAKQRKGALNNWKRVGRVTLAALKKKNLSGEQMRRQMWGTGVNTSPAKVSSRKTRDPQDILYETNSAMYAVADACLFTHDILIAPEAPKEQPLPEQEKKKKKKGKQVSKINLQATKTTFNVDPNTGELKRTTEIIGDPLRDLVLMSEKEAEETDPTQIQTLAHRASLIGSEEIKIQVVTPAVQPSQPSTPTSLAPPQPLPSITPPPLPSTPPPTITTTPALKSETPTLTPQQANLPENQMTDNLHAMFTEATLDPEKEKEFYRKLEALEDTDDSDALIERPPLGRISLIRRAKSAISKSSAQRSAPNDKLTSSFNFAWDSQTPKVAFRPVQESVIQIEDYKDENEIVTVDDVKQKMNEFHLRRRPDLEREFRVKKSRGPRYKNKVSPENTANEGRYKSGSHSQSSDEAHNPLEPWSTRNLQNINQILKQK
ncbi:uncharacterized protein LOC129613315 [Condylostylus longicornis]|uniref:uncharacterized protein LOC129613315 n=1 Tax=Condylostylus longicornis TaxID=2530218 RepID=UPI00244DA678|nr:uncharacterized protein LOC129613315 [Condylostylus longicornis]